jgi:hypothetical protein
MADDDVVFKEALATLAGEDADAARDAEAAIEWLTAGEGLNVLTQEGVQTFLWYSLPMSGSLTLIRRHQLGFEIRVLTPVDERPPTRHHIPKRPTPAPAGVPQRLRTLGDYRRRVAAPRRRPRRQVDQPPPARRALGHGGRVSHPRREGEPASPAGAEDLAGWGSALAGRDYQHAPRRTSNPP